MLDIKKRLISVVSVRKWDDGIQWDEPNQKLNMAKERMKKEIDSLM